MTVSCLTALLQFPFLHFHFPFSILPHLLCAPSGFGAHGGRLLGTVIRLQPYGHPSHLTLGSPFGHLSHLISSLYHMPLFTPSHTSMDTVLLSYLIGGPLCVPPMSIRAARLWSCDTIDVTVDILGIVGHWMLAWWPFSICSCTVMSHANRVGGL